MIKILIVDDERRICKLISHLIDFSDKGLELLGFAYDGLSAFDIIKAQHPHIVITDINMPGMDGIELIRETRAAGMTDIHFVILSGYGTFEYARSAVKYQVDDYLLKPVEKKDLVQVLDKLTAIIRAKEAQKGKTQQLERKLESAATKIRSYFLSDVIYNPEQITSKTVDEMNQAYNLNFSQGIFRSLIINILPAEKGALITDIVRRIDQQFKQSLNEKYFEYESIIDKQQIIVAVNYDVSLVELMPGILAYQFESLTKRHEIASFVHMNLLIGNAVNDIGHINKSYLSAIRLLNMGILMGYNAFYDTGLSENGIWKGFSVQQKNAYIESLGKGGAGSIKQFLMLYAEDNKKILERNPHYIDNILIDLADMIICQGNPNNKSYLVEKKLNLLSECSTTVSLDSFAETAERLLKEMHAVIADDSAEKQNQPTKQALRYIDEHYADSLTLDGLAMKVYLSPGYFSAAFKKEIGMNFSDYLIKVRIDKAKQLLSQPDIPIFAVGEAVGYTDQHYFSRVFKKTVKVTPVEYRRLRSLGLPE